MFEVWLQMSDTNIDRENPSDLPALIITITCTNNFTVPTSGVRLVYTNTLAALSTMFQLI